MFIHLHTHSYYSFLDALASPEELARAAGRWGMPALALVERWGLSGAVQFHLACREAGVQPILGLEVDIQHAQGTGALALLAMDAAGWSNLCRLSTTLQTTAERRLESAALPWEALAQHTQGLLCLSGGVRGLLAGLLQGRQTDSAVAYLGDLAELFPGRLYAEIQLQSPADHTWVDELSRLAKRLGLPLLASCAVHYLEPQQAPLQRTLAAMRLNTTLDRLPQRAAAPAQAYLLSTEQAQQRFAAYPEALAATLEAAERCAFELPIDQPHYPEIPLPAGQNAAQVLRARAYEGARQRYGELQAGVVERLDHELAVISERGYAPLFLIMQEILDYARREGVPLSSRGSAASSLVAHCLGITWPDPLAHDLYFERFLNVARATPPDIDTDLCSVRRDKVIRYVYDRFGDERVAMVATINRFRMRSALRDVAKAHGLAPAEISKLVDELPYRGWGPPWLRSGGAEAFNGLRQRHPEARLAQVLDQAAAILDLPRHLSVHPGGVVITPGELLELVPLHLASKGLVITQFDLESIERLGLIKIDLLGTRGLTVLGDVAEAAWRQAQSGDDRAAALPCVSQALSPVGLLEAIPSDDDATSALVRAAQTVGCFQIESPGMRMTLREVDAHSPQDILVALALYRPGPLTGGLKEAFIRRHLGREPVQHLHPSLEPLLKETHGVILYQEQVLRILSQLAGLSLGDADLMRRAMSHFDPGERMQTLRARFVEGALERSGVPVQVGEQVWELMAAFAGYGFPKAHAASYARVAWQSAWCKAHFPAEFIAAVLANWGGYYGQRVYMSEARRLGLAVRPPQVNYAQAEFSLARPGGEAVLFVGLNQVRGLTRRTIQRILAERPFHSLSDFLARVDPKPVEAESLARIGALAGFGTIPELLAQINRGGWQYAQPMLFDLPVEKQAEDWSLAQRVAAQEALLGVPVDAHPLELLPPSLVADAKCLTTAQALERRGQVVRVLGIRQTMQRFFDQEGRPFYRLELEDTSGVLTVLVSSDLYRRQRALLATRRPLVVEGKVWEGERFEEVALLAQHIADLAPAII